MRKLLLMCILLSISLLYAKTSQLMNFEEIYSAMERGETVKVIIHYGDCQLISDNKIQDRVPNAVGGMKLDTFEYFEKMSIGNKRAFFSSSETKLISIRGKFTYNYAKIKVFADNEVRVIARYLDTKNYKITMDESFYSEINNGENEGAAYFYLVE